MGFGGSGGGGGSIASSADVALSNPANNEVLTYDTNTSKWKNSASGGVPQEVLDAKVTTIATLTTTPSSPQFRRNLTYALDVNDPNIAEVAISGVTKFWHNEWGAIRGTSPYNWGDAMVRAIRSNGDGITQGNALELVDRRSSAPASPGNIMWGVRWTDGRMVQGGAQVGSVFVLNANQSASDIPAALPAGTLIVRKRAV